MSGPLDPEELTGAAAPVVAEVPAATRMGPVHLSVADLGRSVEFYERAIGLRVRARAGGQATVGANEDLLVLTEEPGARSARGFTGLYHFALLLPARADLARWLTYAAREHVPLTGLADHFVSEAIYLQDPDDHGIEIYWDRPRAQWEGQVARRMTTLPLDTRSLINELKGPGSASFNGLAKGTTMGHVHLRVADIPHTVAFYRDVLGFGLMAALGPQAAFLSAGGYHHHIGANVWESRGAQPAPPGTARLQGATVLLPSTADRDRLAAVAANAGAEPEALPGGGVRVLDPSGNPLILA